MRVICVDDEYLIVAEVTAQCQKLPSVREALGFTEAGEALAYCRDHAVDVALLDIDMPEMDGIELAAAIKKICPKTAIVFLTAYSQYALKAFGVHASGYLLKPVEPDKLAEEISYASEGKDRKQAAHIEVKTFGGFDLFVDGEQVTFRKAKSKELLAYLVDKQGSSVTRAEAFSILWEDREYDRSMQTQLDVIIRILRDALDSCGAQEMFSLKKGTMRIVPETFSCDVYRFFQGDPEAVNMFRGEYMSAYSWASITESYIARKAFGKEME